MAVRVRLFAALREAAGTAETEAAPGELRDVLAELASRYGEPFASRLTACSALVDGQPARPETGVADGAEVALLPPVSGGAPLHEPELVPTASVVAAVAVPVVLLLALLGGGRWFVAAVVVLCAVVLLDLSAVLAVASARPVLVAAALPGIGLPLAAAWRPATGWEQVPGWVAAGLLSASALMLVFGRRREVVAGIGSTLAAGLVVGLGAAGLLLLLGLPHGFRWVLALLVVVGLADLGSGLAPRLAGVQPAVGGVAGALAGGAAAALTLRPPLDLIHGALLVAAALVAAVGGAETGRALTEEGGLEPGTHGMRPGAGGLLGGADGVLLAAPVVYVLARAAGL